MSIGQEFKQFAMRGNVVDLAVAVKRALDEAVKKKEWKNTSEALVKANNELQNLHNNREEAIFSMNLIHNKMLHVSIAHEAGLGYPQAAFFENPLFWYEIALPEDKQIINDLRVLYNRLLKLKTIFLFSRRFNDFSKDLSLQCLFFSPKEKLENLQILTSELFIHYNTSRLP